MTKQNPSYVVGLTGGIGSGKTLVSDTLQSFGIDIIDADVIARDVVAPKSHGLTSIVERYGVGITHPDGTLNRAKLRELVFVDPQETQWLNSLLHPMIRSEILRQVNLAKPPYCILSVPLLFENKLDKLCDLTVVVNVNETEQLARASLRDGVDMSSIKRIMAQQLRSDDRAKRADVVIDNNGTKEQTITQIKQFHENMLINLKKN